MDYSEFQALNIRFLLWQRNVKRENWIKVLSDLLNIDNKEAERLLLHGGLSHPQLEKLCSYFEISEDVLLYDDLSAELDILKENLKYLIDSLEHGGRKKLANEVGVDVTTITRWSKGKNPPDQSNLKRLSNSLQISDSIDLTLVPLFLEINPIMPSERRRWLSDAIEKLDIHTLNELFPALHKLLRD